MRSVETNFPLPKESDDVGRAVLRIAQESTARAVEAAIREVREHIAHREAVIASITDPLMRESVIRFIKAP